MRMKFGLSPGLVKRSLAGHSWIGLMIAAPLFLVCLSGTLTVFYKEFERWEQPDIQESTRYSPAAVERAYNGLAGEGAVLTHHMFVSLPTADMPRTSISNEKTGWFLNEDGSLGEPISHEWTQMLVNLHLYLHLPANFGMILVSALGALLCGLIVSGILAHPRIFKDAFALRLGGSRLLEQADIHNRLSVWSSPFQLMIAVTGAYFGLVQLMSIVMTSVYFDGNSAALTARVFGEEPQLQQPMGPIALQKILAEMKTIAPEATPFYVTVEDADTPQRYLIVGAQHPGRLIYAEQYRFDSAGNYLDKVGFSDGEAGRQIVFSVYRLHFGHFGGFAVKVIYGILGLAMTIVCVAGINVWLARRKRRDYLNNVWAGFVWGTAPALAAAAIAQVMLGISATAVFWGVAIAATALAQWWNDERSTKRRLEIAAAAVIGVLIVSHIVKFGSSAFTAAALWVNGCLLLTALTLLLTGLRRREHSAITNQTLANDLTRDGIDAV